MIQFSINKWLFAPLSVLIFSFSVMAQDTQTYQYFGASGKYAFKNNYFLALLEQALEVTKPTHGDFALVQYPVRMNQSRAIENMAKSCDFDIQWHMTTAGRESAMRAIKIPLYKGLYGYRALMIHQDNQTKFAEINSKRQLQLLTAGQGSDWPDTGILKANYFNVYGVDNYHALFDLLQQKRIDYFPRSVAEIDDELLLHEDKPLIREPHLLLYYPAPIYFFVCPEHEVLAKRIELGLQQLIESGAFAEHFTASKAYQGFLAAGGFKQKHIFELRNPMVNSKSLPGNESLWLLP